MVASGEFATNALLLKAFLGRCFAFVHRHQKKLNHDPPFLYVSGAVPVFAGVVSSMFEGSLLSGVLNGGALGKRQQRPLRLVVKLKVRERVCKMREIIRCAVFYSPALCGIPVS